MFSKNPAFGPAQIRELTNIFIDKSLELRDVWIREIKRDENKERINVLSWLSRMTLDVIGLAGVYITRRLCNLWFTVAQVLITNSRLFQEMSTTTNSVVPSRSSSTQDCS